MKCIYTSPDLAELGLLKNILQKAGIRCMERNEEVARTIPAAPFQAEVWIENDEDYSRAQALVAEWRHPTRSEGPPWTCSKCGEVLGSQFVKCWKCGTGQHAGVSTPKESA
jgi:hypothetical protein